MKTLIKLENQSIWISICIILRSYFFLNIVNVYELQQEISKKKEQKPFHYS